MSIGRIIAIIIFLFVGISALYLGLTFELDCVNATINDNFAAGLPLTIFGFYSLATALFLWAKPDIGQSLAVFTTLIASILIIATLFDLSIPIIKTSCVS